jgi:hypothetical protein
MSQCSWIRATKVGTKGRRAVGEVVTATAGGWVPAGPAALVSMFAPMTAGMIYCGVRLKDGAYAVSPMQVSEEVSG